MEKLSSIIKKKKNITKKSNLKTDKSDKKSVSANTPKKINGGKRPGSGRPKGAMSEHKKKQIASEKAMQQVIFSRAKDLLSKQMSLAMGLNYLYCDRVVRRNKHGDPIQRKKCLVTDPEEIENFLNNVYTNSPDDDYYYITTSQPDVQAIKDLWDRAFGRPSQKVELDPEDPNDPNKKGGVSIGIIKFN